MVVGDLVPEPPPEVHHLELHAVSLPAVALQLGVDKLGERVPLQQHVGVGGAREDPHQLAAQWSQTIKVSNKDLVNLLIIHRQNFTTRISWISGSTKSRIWKYAFRQTCRQIDQTKTNPNPHPGQCSCFVMKFYFIFDLT